MLRSLAENDGSYGTSDFARCLLRAGCADHMTRVLTLHPQSERVAPAATKFLRTLASTKNHVVIETIVAAGAVPVLLNVAKANEYYFDVCEPVISILCDLCRVESGRLDMVRHNAVDAIKGLARQRYCCEYFAVLVNSGSTS